ncbi:MAG TPA: carboxypeptidase-like regulatory domain-containing protein [Candidatus Acidoferrum sp.]|jgi:Carboxypeptidase regulatory-like domain|nr:carboxypeptidase-like regulatory domain-containing protein [Candidatus Acidoferrum sp.]
MRVIRGIVLTNAVAVCALTLLSFAGVLRAQQPAPPPPDSQSSQQAQKPDSSSSAPSSAPAAQPSQTSSSSSSSSNKRGRIHANDFLVIGTVFTDKAYALPGAKIRVRRASEKKFRWETYTNSRGEFALRVPQGDEYEIVILAKGFADQSNAVSAKSGISEDTVVFHMQPASGGKK